MIEVILRVCRSRVLSYLQREKALGYLFYHNSKSERSVPLQQSLLFEYLLSSLVGLKDQDMILPRLLIKPPQRTKVEQRTTGEDSV